MAPPRKIDFVLLRLAFVSYIPPHNPHISNLSRKHLPTGSIYQVRDWFDSVMLRERSNLPPNADVRYFEWRIVSGNEDLFTLQGNRFDKIMLILSEDNISWVFYQDLPLDQRVEGSASLPISYCGCCFNNHYKNIIDKIKETLSFTKLH